MENWTRRWTVSSDVLKIQTSITSPSLGHGEWTNKTHKVEDAVPTREAVELRSRLREIGPNAFILETISSGRYTAKRLLTAFDIRPPEVFGGRPDQGYYRLLGLALLRDLSTRHKLPQYNTVDDAVKLLKTCQNIMVITGAGVCLPESVETKFCIETNQFLDFDKSWRAGFSLQRNGLLRPDA